MSRNRKTSVRERVVLAAIRDLGAVRDATGRDLEAFTISAVVVAARRRDGSLTRSQVSHALTRLRKSGQVIKQGTYVRSRRRGGGRASTWRTA